MKKVRIIAAALCCALLCSGCTMLERSHSSSTAHVDYSVTEDSSILRAESYQALVNSLLYFVTEHVGSGTIRLYNYTGNVEADLQRACTEVQEADPLGAYAVSGITYENTRILTYYEVKFNISYRRSIAEVAEIRSVSGVNGVRQALKRMTDNRATYATLRTAYFNGDIKLVSDLFWLSFYSTPTAALEPPDLTVSFYPEEGTQRILEVTAVWPVSPAELAEYTQNLVQSANLLTESAPPANEQYTVDELATLLRQRINYDPSGSSTALSALQGEPVNDLGVLLAMEYLCQRFGTEVTVVADTSGAQMWLIVLTPSGHRHLLPRDLRPAPAEPATPDESVDSAEELPIAPEEAPEASIDPKEPVPDDWQLPLYTDEELAAMGFDWPRDLHPACVDYSGIVPE